MSQSHDVVHVLHHANGEIFGVAESAEEAASFVTASYLTPLTHVQLAPDATVFGFVHRRTNGSMSLDLFSVRDDTYQHYSTVSQSVPVPAASLAWRFRERSKDRTGIPWATEKWWIGSVGELHHYVYPSQESPGMLCYTPDDTYGNADRQLRTKPGRYLRRFFGDVLSDREIAEWAAAWSAVYRPPTLQFAHSPDDIARVYVNGPRSCMSYEPDYFNLDVHPTYVYGAGDLAVAYIADPTDPDRITGRALVWPDRKIRSIIYGDYQRMSQLLDEAGYSTAGDFVGARLLRVEDSNGRLIAPYVDGEAHELTDHGVHLTIEYEGDYTARSTNGRVQSRYTCNVCNEELSEDDLWYNDDGETFCSYCYSERYRNCTECNDEIHVNDCRENRHGDIYCEDCYEYLFTDCHDCGDETDTEQAYEHNGLDYCHNCYHDKFIDCERCASTVEIDSNNTTLTDNNEFICLECAQVEAIA